MVLDQIDSSAPFMAYVEIGIDRSQLAGLLFDQLAVNLVVDYKIWTDSNLQAHDPKSIHILWEQTFSNWNKKLHTLKQTQTIAQPAKYGNEKVRLRIPQEVKNQHAIPFED